MSEYDIADLDVAATSREAERLIEQRIEELRAAALGIDMPPIGEDRPSPAPDTTRTTTLRSTVVDVPGHDQQPPASLNAALSRIEHAVQEDVARIEQMLRGWGNPGTVVGQVGEQVLASLDRVERGLRRDIEALQQAVQVSGPAADEALIGAIARMSVQLERQVGGGLHALAEQVAGAQAAHARAIAELRAGEGTITEQLATDLADTRDILLASVDTVEDAAELLRAQLATEVQQLEAPLSQVHERVVEAERRLGRDITDVTRAVTRIEKSLNEGSHEGGARTERTALAITALRELVQQEIGRLAAAHEQLESQLQDLSTDPTTQAAVDATVEQATRTLDERIAAATSDIGAQLESASTEIASRIDGSTDALATGLTEAKSSIEQLLGESLAREHEQVSQLLDQMGTYQVQLREELVRIEETLLASQDDVPEEIAERVTTAMSSLQERVETLQQRVEQHTTTVAGTTSEALDTVTSLLEELRDARNQHALEMREATTHQLEELRTVISGELEYNRLQHVRDIESFIDAMSRGWGALFTRFERTDRRIARLEKAIDVLLDVDLESVEGPEADAD